MKLFSIFLISILLLQALAEVSMHSNAANNQLAEIDERGDLLALRHKKHHPRIQKTINCGHACSRRCRETSRKKVCHRACKSCCKRCNCVPPGTYGNKEACPCYASLRTHGNKPKCP